MSQLQMINFLLDKHPHWSNSFINDLMRSPSKLTAIYLKEKGKQKRVVVQEPLFPTPTAQSMMQDYLDFLESKEHQDWCLIED